MKIYVWIVSGMMLVTAAMAQTIGGAEVVHVAKEGVRIRNIHDFGGYNTCSNALTPLCSLQTYDCDNGVAAVHLSQGSVLWTYRGTECASAICFNIYDCRGECWARCRVWDGIEEGCPILIDTENDGIHLTGLDDPVWFDINADGTPDLISWTDRSEGLLALDRNVNGVIDDGGELFGNATLLTDGTRSSNGYLALAEFDSVTFGGNGDGHIDSYDLVFGSLQIWTDVSHDGTSQPQELRTLENVGIRRIDLDYHRSNRKDRDGNNFRFLSKALVETSNGTLRPVLTWDVFFLVAP